MDLKGRNLSLYLLKICEKSYCYIAKKICAVYWDGDIAESTVHKWFSRFRCGNFHLEDWECSGGSTVVSDDLIEFDHEHCKAFENMIGKLLQCLDASLMPLLPILQIVLPEKHLWTNNIPIMSLRITN